MATAEPNTGPVAPTAADPARPVQPRTSDATPVADADFDKSFTPVATMVLLLGYVIIFALLWGSVYFFDLLARR